MNTHQDDENKMNHSHIDHSHMNHNHDGHIQEDHAQEPSEHVNTRDPDSHAMHEHGSGIHENGSQEGTHAGQKGHMGNHDHHAMMVRDFKRRFFISLYFTVPLLLLSHMIQMFLGVNWRFAGDSYILFALATILFIYGGKPFFTGSVDELKKKSPAMMTLITLAISAAYIYSTVSIFVFKGNDFFWELATLIVIMLLGHWIEMRSVMGASKALDELVKLMPEDAHLIKENGETVDVPVEHLKVGDSVLVKPGEKIPIDGLVFEGKSAVNEAMITGESMPVDKEKGSNIIGGSVNGEGMLKFTVQKVGDQTFLSQVIRLVNDAQASKSKTQRLADITAKWLFYISVTTGALTFTVWTISMQDVGFAIERAVTVMIIACPHALGLATPLVTAVSTSLAAKNGLLIKNRAAFENSRKLNTVVFDKTGTLTQGEFGVTDIHGLIVSNDELLGIAYSVEYNSEHPIAKGIVKEGKRLGLQLKEVNDFKTLPGKGLQALVDGKNILIVSPGYLNYMNITFDKSEYERLAGEGKTVVFLLENDTLLGYIALADIIRDTAGKAVETLKSMNVKTIMLTGDNRKAASYVGGKLKIDRVIAEVLPQEKASKIDELQKEGMTVAMTGDGVNDAPPLAKADLGIAIGAGTNVAIETADVILVKSNPLDVVNVLKLSRATYSKMFQNLLWATAYNVVAIPLAAGVLYSQGILISPALGAVFMSLSTVIVAINARFLKIK